jgi:hypothetical protein
MLEKATSQFQVLLNVQRFLLLNRMTSFSGRLARRGSWRSVSIGAESSLCGFPWFSANLSRFRDADQFHHSLVGRLGCMTQLLAVSLFSEQFISSCLLSRSHSTLQKYIRKSCLYYSLQLTEKVMTSSGGMAGAAFGSQIMSGPKLGRSQASNTRWYEIFKSTDEEKQTRQQIREARQAVLQEMKPER